MEHGEGQVELEYAEHGVTPVVTIRKCRTVVQHGGDAHLGPPIGQKRPKAVRQDLATVGGTKRAAPQPDAHYQTQ